MYPYEILISRPAIASFIIPADFARIRSLSTPSGVSYLYRNTINNLHVRALLPPRTRFVPSPIHPYPLPIHRQTDIHGTPLGRAPRHSRTRYTHRFANGYCSYSCSYLPGASQPARSWSGVGISDKLEKPATRIPLFFPRITIPLFRERAGRYLHDKRCAHFRRPICTRLSQSLSFPLSLPFFLSLSVSRLCSSNLSDITRLYTLLAALPEHMYIHSLHAYSAMSSFARLIMNNFTHVKQPPPPPHQKILCENLVLLMC